MIPLPNHGGKYALGEHDVMFQGADREPEYFNRPGKGNVAGAVTEFPDENIRQATRRLVEGYSYRDYLEDTGR
ncbi:hypothetical protein [Desulfurispirillum indicum]|nr:hypothetical protein [Desulfurispirillum indicum]